MSFSESFRESYSGESVGHLVSHSVSHSMSELLIHSMSELLIHIYDSPPMIQTYDSNLSRTPVLPPQGPETTCLTSTAMVYFQKKSVGRDEKVRRGMG